MTDPIAARAAECPDRLGLVDAETGTTWTYADYDVAVQTAAERLAGLGIESGDRVAILSETRPAVAHVFFACWRLGAVAVPINARLQPSEVTTNLDVVDPALVLAAPPQVDLAATAADDRPLRCIDASDGHEAALDAEPPESFEPVAVSDGGDVAALFTSGTTGDPKAVRLTAGNFAAAAAAHRERFGARPDDRWLCPLSTYHMGGLAILVRSAVYGSTAVLQRTDDAFDPAATRRALEEHDCTALSVVPVMLRRLLDDGDLPDSLRFVLSGGAPTPPSLVERALARDVPICPTYGMTETTSQVATATPEDVTADPTTVGRPLDGVDVTIASDSGTLAPAGTVGEIVVDGPTVTPGYVGGGGRFDDLGFHTGDYGRLDDAGVLTVLDRREDRIVTGGENVHPAEIAAVLRDHPDVADVVVLGIPDDEWGERVAALVVTASGGSLDSDALVEHAAGWLAKYKLPRTVAFTDALPRTPSGTVDREAARAEIRRLTDA